MTRPAVKIRIAVTPEIAGELLKLRGQRVVIANVANRAQPNVTPDWTVTLMPEQAFDDAVREARARREAHRLSPPCAPHVVAGRREATPGDLW